MTTAKIVFVTVLAGAIGVATAVLGPRWLRPTAPGAPSRAPQPIERLTVLPDFSLPDLRGQLHRNSEWAGRVLVLNFWASWCPPCRQEIPIFVEMQEELTSRGLQFVGIAIDQRDDAAQFVAAVGINYPILIGDLGSIEMSRRFGNRFQSLPFTVIFDRSGKVVYTQGGELTRKTLDEQILPLL